MKNTITVAMLAGMIALPSAVQADEWDFVFAPYLWMADTKGSTVVKGLPANLDVDFFDDIADNLDSGIEFHFEAANRSQGLTYIADVTWLETSSSQYLPSGAKLKPTSSLIIAELKVAGDLFDVPAMDGRCAIYGE